MQVQLFRFVIISVALFPVCVFRLQVWLCEFCGYENGVSNGVRRMCVSHTSGLFSDELYLPTQSEDDYQNLEDTMVVFCVDISGSMSVTTEVEHRFIIMAQCSYCKRETGNLFPPFLYFAVEGRAFHTKALTDINAYPYLNYITMTAQLKNPHRITLAHYFTLILASRATFKLRSI